MTKMAILQCADTGPLESLVVMLRSVGYECFTLTHDLKKQLRAIGCDTVLDIQGLVNSWGYEQPMKLPEAGPREMEYKDALYVDVKAHRNGPKVWKQWPHLKNRTLWYRINGGKPEHVIRNKGQANEEDCGDEESPPCPILTPNLWYREVFEPGQCVEGGSENLKKTAWADKSYACWPPFHRFSEFDDRRVTEKRAESGNTSPRFQPPICLIHNVQGWGYSPIIDSIRKLGVKCHGSGSPDGLINHREIAVRLSSTLAMVHLKSNDAPGYALYEALASGCPVVCSHRLIWRCLMQDLLVDGETCLTFDRAENHKGLTEEEVTACTAEVKAALDRLSDPIENIRIGNTGRERLRKLMWSDRIPTDVESLRAFMSRWFG